MYGRESTWDHRGQAEQWLCSTAHCCPGSYRRPRAGLSLCGLEMTESFLPPLTLHLLRLQTLSTQPRKSSPRCHLLPFPPSTPPVQALVTLPGTPPWSAAWMTSAPPCMRSPTPPFTPLAQQPSRYVDPILSTNQNLQGMEGNFPGFCVSHPLLYPPSQAQCLCDPPPPVHILRS